MLNYYWALPLCACSPTTPGLRLLNPTAPSKHLQLRCFQPWPKTFIFLPSAGMAPSWCFQFSALCFCVLWACAKVPDWLARLTWTPCLLVHALWLGWHQGHWPTKDRAAWHHQPTTEHPDSPFTDTQEDIMFHTRWQHIQCSDIQRIIITHSVELGRQLL